MVFLSEEEINTLTKYAQDKQQVSVPQIQRDLDWSYAKARAGIDKLVGENRLKYEGGVDYKYVKSKSEEIKFMSDQIDKAARSLEKLATIEGYDISQEQEIIFNYVNIMNKLSEGTRLAKTPKVVPEPPPRNTKLSYDYKMLSESAKILVKMAVEVANEKKAARLGLFESSMRWKDDSDMGIAYYAAFSYINKITEREFKRIKYIFANCQPQ